MKRYILLFWLEWKRACKILPGIFLGAIALALITSAIVFCGQKFLYGQPESKKALVALAVYDDSPVMDTLTKYVEEMEGVRSFCRFIYTSEEEALRMMADGSAAAAMIIPEQTAESILSGENIPIRLVFPKHSTLAGALLKELTAAGARSLSSAQAGIYAISDLYLKHQADAGRQAAFDRLNLKNLSFFSARERMFRSVLISATEQLSVTEYYLASGSVLFLLLFGITCSSFIRSDSRALKRMLAVNGIRSKERMLIKLLVLFLLYLTVAVLLLLPLSALSGQLSRFGPSAFAQLCLLLLLASALTLALYQAAPTPSGGVLLISPTAIILVFLAGGFLPLPFLPAGIAALAPYLPSTQMIGLAGSLICPDKATAPALPHTLLLILLFYAAAVLFCQLRKEDSSL